jgi:hypothetical protein
MTKTFTFKVENDNGELVEKTVVADWVKHKITSDLQSHGYRTVFRVRQTSDNSVEAYNTSGDTITYTFGGFDGFEVLEPYNHGSWPKKPREKTRWNKYLATLNSGERVKRIIELECNYLDISAKYDTDTIISGLTAGLKKRRPAGVREMYFELRRLAKTRTA